MKVTVTLYDTAARQIVRSLAKRYALLCIHSRLPPDTVDAPWFRKDATYSKWMKTVDRERADYRKNLESFVVELPDVPAIEWKPYKSPSTGKNYSVHYNAIRSGDVTDSYAASIVESL